MYRTCLLRLIFKKKNEAHLCRPLNSTDGISAMLFDKCPLLWLCVMYGSFITYSRIDSVDY